MPIIQTTAQIGVNKEFKQNLIFGFIRLRLNEKKNIISTKKLVSFFLLKFTVSVMGTVVRKKMQISFGKTYMKTYSEGENGRSSIEKAIGAEWLPFNVLIL